MNSTSRFARPAVSRTASSALIAAVLLTASSLFSPFASRDVSSCASSFFPPFAASIVSAADDVPEKLRTVAERSNFAATSRHAEVEALGRALAESSPLVRYLEFGETVEGRKLPLLVVAEPPVASPDEAAKTDKAVVLVFANIHGGEVDGKEGVLMFVRDLVRAAERPLLKDVVLLVVPNLNADGNERFALDNRPEQDGPAQGMGVRENAQGLDLNRDYIKLETPEIRALVRLVQQWNPPLVLDCHTTNGSWHRHTMTYDVNRHPGSDPRLIKLAQQQLVPHVDRRLEELGGWKGFYYGNFSREHTVWETFPLQPRLGTHYFALRQRVAVLAESYSHASYKDRCLASRDMVRAVVEFAASHKKPLRETVEAASRDAAVDSSARRSNDGAKEKEKEPAQHRQVPLRVAPAARDGVSDA